MISSIPALRIFRCGLLAACLFAASSVFGNIPGGGSGTGANITLTSTSTTAAMSNGIVSIAMTKSSAQITTINYTFNNTGSNQTLNLLSGNSNGGKLYWEHSNNQGMDFTSSYTVVADPTTNGGDYAEISLYSTTQANMPFAVHYSMRRGSPGFYVTAIWTHDSSNGAFGMGECRNNIYAGSIFNWMSVDATRNKLMQVSGGTSTGVPTAPVECSLWTHGIYQGQYEDKYKYSAAWGDQRVWGWSSVGASGKNVGLWNVSATSEYYNGGPLHAELMCHIGTTILNMFNGSHYEMGTDGSFVAGETWGKVCGPYFVYCNNVSKTITDPVQVSQTLYNDALAQGTAEASAWPYSWFSNANYAGTANRGSVTGKMVINDSSNPNAKAANLWVGLIQQPLTSTGTYDFQQWMKPYQFWVHTDGEGNFTVPAVIAGSNYTLYAFGQGAAGTFMSQGQTGGSPPFLENISASPFSVTVTGGATTALGNVTWTPTRVGPTVFEIGYPDRTARKFKHGEDWWVGDIGASPTSPSPVWSKWMEFPHDFPSGVNYTVGTSRWTTDWNFAQPVTYSSTGTWNSSSSTITFNLASAPASGTQASLYLGIASDYYTALIMTVNGTNLASASGLSATPSSLPSTGFIPTSQGSNTTLREGINGAFSDERITFGGTLLKTGANTITIAQRQVGGTYFADHAMYDYLRLELTNYVPPAPAAVTAFAGNNSALVTWPAVPGATSYKVLRSTVSGSGYATVATGVIGPVSGSGPTHASYVDITALNGTTYYYVVQSTNPVNSSASSAPGAGVIPSSGSSTSVPAAPAGLTSTPGSGSVMLNWTASPGANLYTVKRSTLTYNGGGTTIPLNTITLTNSVTGTGYSDLSVTNGSLYSYSVSASNSVGSSVDGASAASTPVAVAPASSPANLTATPGTQQILLNWSAVTGVTGYIIQVSTTPGGPYTYLTSISSLTYNDGGQADNTTYYYVIAATNSGGTSANSAEVSATTAPAAPVGLAATPGNTQVTLSWTASTAAASYKVQRGTATSGPYTAVATISGTSYTDNSLTNGSVYYYVVNAVNANGSSVASSEINATPVTTVPVAPLGLTATAGYQQVVLNWTASAAATGYTVLRGTASGGPYTPVASGIATTSYTHTGLSNGTTYYYVVAASSAGGAGAYSSEVNGTPFGAPPSLTWKGASSTAWNTATANWTNAGNAATYADSNSVTFDDTATTGSVVISSTVAPGSVTFNNSTLTYTVGGSAISGSIALAKTGSGTLILTGANSYSGDTVLSGGKLYLGSGSGTGQTASLGSGTLAMSNGTTFRMNPSGSGTIFPSTNIVIAAGATVYLESGTTASGYGGTISTGDSNSNVVINSGSVNPSAANTKQFGPGFTGTVNVGSGMKLNFRGTISGVGNGGDNATFNVTGTGVINAKNSPSGNIALGALTGDGVVAGGETASTTLTYTIGAKNVDSTFSGTLVDGAAGKLAAIIKTGSGTQTLSGINTYTGPTTVTAGNLSITGSLAATPVTVATTGTRGGSGSIAGAVACNGTLAPGVSAGTLTLGNGLVLASTSTLAYDLGSTSDLTTVTGNLTLDGTINVTAATPLASGTYNLITYSGTLANNSLAVGTLPAGCTATVNTATAGQVKLVVVNSTNTAPQITAGPNASANPVVTTNTNLSVTGADDAGEGNLT